MTGSATARQAPSEIPIPWGRLGSLSLELPADWPAPEVLEPDLAGALEDYPCALNRALDAPLDAEPLERLVQPGMSVAIVVDDPSRWTPVAEALPIVLDRLRRAGLADSRITISVGVGRHHAVDQAAMQERVGEGVAQSFTCSSPPVDDLSQYVELGTTTEGVPVRVFRPVAEADLRILIGSVLPHLQAGFGGGYKLIFPGTSHRSTLGALHRMGLAGEAGRLLGSDPEQNPMRRAIRSAAALLRGPCYSISHLIGAPGQVLHVAAGQPDRVQNLLSSEARRRFCVPSEAPADLIVAGNYPWPGDPMQSFKVLLHHRAACKKPGGVLVGFFWTDPHEIDRSFPLRPMRMIAATGALGGHGIRGVLRLAEGAASALRSPSAFMLRWARELVVDRTVLVYAPALHERIGGHLGPVRVFADQDALWNAAERALRASGGGGLRVRIFPQGGLSYCPQREPMSAADGPHSEARSAAAPAPGGLR